jgi:hypothetical protein
MPYLSIAALRVAGMIWNGVFAPASLTWSAFERSPRVSTPTSRPGGRSSFCSVADASCVQYGSL